MQFQVRGVVTPYYTNLHSPMNWQPVQLLQDWCDPVAAPQGHPPYFLGPPQFTPK